MLFAGQRLASGCGLGLRCSSRSCPGPPSAVPFPKPTTHELHPAQKPKGETTPDLLVNAPLRRPDLLTPPCHDCTSALHRLFPPDATSLSTPPFSPSSPHQSSPQPRFAQTLETFTMASESETPVVDTTSISPVQAGPERRNSLEKHLQQRPDAQDLKNRHILLDTNAAP